MSARRYLSRILGGLQCVMGSTASALAFMIYTSAAVREDLSIGEEEITLFMLIFLVFGVFSIVSGIILLRKKC